MAELKKKEDQLTTADLAGRADDKNKAAKDVRPNDPARPELVRDAREPKREEIRRDISEGHREGQIREGQMEAARVGNIDAGRKGNLEASRGVHSQPLFAETEVTELRGRWTGVQTAFVDEPRHAVEEADKLVATVMQRLADGFASERANLEKQWDRGDNVSTEDLRVALQRYRSFFDRLLAA